jgi:Calcineurin-like phosphoesterase
MTRSRLVWGLVLSVLLSARGEPPSGGTSAAKLQSPVEVAGTWEFTVGGPDERLLVAATQMPMIRQPVTLPHRVPRPNTALWYAKDLSIPPRMSEGSPQWAWLQAEVRSPAWKNACWRIVLVHQPPWSRSWAGYEGDEAMRRVVEPLVRDHGLNVVVSGHSHAYEYLARPVGTRVVHVLITGGAGGSLEAPQPDALGTAGDRLAVRHHFLYATADSRELTFEAVDLNEQSFDRVAIGRAPSGKDVRRP